MHTNGIKLEKLVDLEKWQKIQDSFSEVLGVALSTFDLNSKLLTKASRSCLLWSKIPPYLPKYCDLCGNCVLQKEKPLDIKEITNFKCPFGLDIFALPIKAFWDRTVAYIVVGPLILNKRKDKSEYKPYAEEIGVDVEEIMDALLEINIFSYNKVRSINRLLSDIFSYMAQTGYHKKRLGEIAPEVAEMDPMFSRYYEERILDAFLNACTIALDADSGSVMTMDKDTDRLRIKVASKLEQRIIDDTSIKIGDGIAGVAAATSEPIILPKDEKKNGLANKMRRKYIKSSMIVPFSKANEHQVYGVINLNVVRKAKEFSDKDIAFVKELINLTSIALIPLDKKQTPKK